VRIVHSFLVTVRSILEWETQEVEKLMLTLADLIQPTHQFVVVSGPFRAGKSLFITSFTEQTLEMVDITACIANTAPEPLGKLELADGEVLYLLEWRGPLLVKALQEMLGSALLGMIVVTDSSDPTRLREARAIVQQLPSLPVVTAANPHQPAKAWPLEVLRIALKLREEDALMACDAAQHQDTVSVVLKLIELLPDSPFAEKLKTALI